MTTARRPPAALPPGERELLDFERGWWQHQGPKERAIRERFAISATRYQQRLNRLVDLPEALTYDPMLVRRLRRLREQRRRRRVAVQLGLPSDRGGPTG
ncbi:MAG: DUF3263 domain-containing protein [Actinobacteria bacterium]|nr:DUF3263 domain-containing protein [Actinomycetota bacterium]